MTKEAFPLARVYSLLEAGPVVLLTTAQRGKINVMPMSWHALLEFEPPLVGCVVSNRNHSFAALRKTRQCVINIPTVDLAEAVVGCGNTSGRESDKFALFGLTPVPAAEVAPPLVAECYASLECRVVDTRLVNRYNFFVLEVVRAWVDAERDEPKTIHHLGWGEFMVAGARIKLASGKP